MRENIWKTMRQVTMPRETYEKLHLAELELQSLKFSQRFNDFMELPETSRLCLKSTDPVKKQQQRILDYIFNSVKEENGNAIVVSYNFFTFLKKCCYPNGEMNSSRYTCKYASLKVSNTILVNTFGLYESDGIYYWGRITDKSIQKGDGLRVLNIFVADFITGGQFLILASAGKAQEKHSSDIDCTFNTIRKYNISCKETLEIMDKDIKEWTNIHFGLLTEVKTQQRLLSGGKKWKDIV